ncbi:hypothetical protein D3C80_1878130 [compost metagenome]
MTKRQPEDDRPEDKTCNEGEVRWYASTLSKTPDNTTDTSNPPVKKEQKHYRQADEHAAQERLDIDHHSSSSLQKIA